MSVSNTEFEDFRKMTKTQNDKLINNVKEKIKEPMKELSSNLEGEYGVEVNLSIGEVIVLDIHFENENAFSYSTFTKYGTNNADEMPGASVDVVTATTLHIKGKVLFLYCHGTKDDLEWTREASTNWLKEIIKANPSN